MRDKTIFIMYGKTWFFDGEPGFSSDNSCCPLDLVPVKKRVGLAMKTSFKATNSVIPLWISLKHFKSYIK